MKILLSCCLSSVLLFMGNVQAGAGHDHGNDMPESAQSVTDNTPRLVMSSEQFELVGTVEGHNMHLYLDDFTTNAPIPDANIELEIAGTSLQAEDEGNGTYHITLADELEEGIHPVLATVLTATSSDLLTGELDIHIEEQEQEEILQGILVTPSQLIIISCLIGAFFLLLIIVMRRDIHRREQAS